MWLHLLFSLFLSARFVFINKKRRQRRQRRQRHDINFIVCAFDSPREILTNVRAAKPFTFFVAWKFHHRIRARRLRNETRLTFRLSRFKKWISSRKRFIFPFTISIRLSLSPYRHLERVGAQLLSEVVFDVLAARSEYKNKTITIVIDRSRHVINERRAQRAITPLEMSQSRIRSRGEFRRPQRVKSKGYHFCSFGIISSASDSWIKNLQQ